MKRLILTLGAAGLLLGANARANVYFSDNFESGLGQWLGGSGGVVVPDPAPASGHGNVLTFTRLWAGGDIWSLATVPAGAYLSFDFKGYGGYIGTAGDWLAGQPGYPGLETGLTYDNTWRHYVVPIRSAGSIMVEDFSGTYGQQSPTFFDNIVVSSTPFTPVPEPSTWIAGILAGLPMLGMIRRRGRK